MHRDAGLATLGRSAVRSLAVWLVASVAAIGAQAAPLQVVNCDCPPWMYQLQSRPRGIVYEITSELARRAGVPVTVTFYPWPRALQIALREPGTVLPGIGRTPAREAQFQWVGPIGTSQTRLYRWRDGTGAPADAMTRRPRPRVGVVHGYVAEKWLTDQGFPIEATSSDEANARMFVARRIDLILSNDIELAYWLDRLGRRFDSVEAVHTWPGEGHDYIGFSLGTPKAVVEAFAAALRQMQADGSYARLLAAQPGGADYAVRR